MIIELNLEQGSQKWLDFRKLHRMASETPAILGVSPYQKALAIKKDKLGMGKVFVNDAMRNGLYQEQFARKAYEDRYEPMRPAVFQNGKYGASLDGINSDKDIIWEVKTPKDGIKSERWQLAFNDQLTPYDYAQVQHQLMVTEAIECHFCVWDYENTNFLLVKVLPDPKYWKSIEKAWDKFYETLYDF